MNKKGFTLVELLVVIAIIGVLSIIIIPSVISINKRINQRLLSEKIENIEASAILYANNNEEIFNGTDVAYIYVYQLVNSNYMTYDVNVGSDSCKNKSEYEVKGCIIDPTTKASINDNYVILKKEGVGVSATYVDVTVKPDTPTNESVTLVDAVCAGFANGTFKGQTYYNNEINECACDQAKSPNKLVLKGTSTEVQACIIAGENVNNYLKYGDTKANWRVLGVYNLNGTITVKMITSDPV